jgi:hypothetical protein
VKLTPQVKNEREEEEEEETDPSVEKLDIAEKVIDYTAPEVAAGMAAIPAIGPVAAGIFEGVAFVAARIIQVIKHHREEKSSNTHGKSSKHAHKFMK